MKKIPAVSIIIPMYNAEKYISELLDSLFAQTFQNFEVIVVDDCSTDDSVVIVNDYIPKFDGRLTLTKTKKNSGGAGYIPRNIGLKLSRGEYIFFVDADDFIVETALEILHTAAIQSAADVVYTPRYYFRDKENKIQLVMDGETSGNVENNSMTLTVDAEENCRKLFVDNGIFHMPWTKFVARKFLIEHKIEFPQIISGGDFLWTIQVVYYAKRFLRLPIALYFYVDNADSVTRKNFAPDKQVVDTIKAFLVGAKALDNLSKKIGVLKTDKKYLHYSMRVFFGNCLARNFEARKNLSTVELYEILLDGLDDSTIAFLFSIIDSDQNAILNLQERVATLKKE